MTRIDDYYYYLGRYYIACSRTGAREGVIIVRRYIRIRYTTMHAYTGGRRPRVGMMYVEFVFFFFFCPDDSTVSRSPFRFCFVSDDYDSDSDSDLCHSIISMYLDNNDDNSSAWLYYNQS